MVVLKKCCPEISSALSRLFNFCLAESIFPSSWKLAHVVHRRPSHIGYGHLFQILVGGNISLVLLSLPLCVLVACLVLGNSSLPVLSCIYTRLPFDHLLSTVHTGVPDCYLRMLDKVQGRLCYLVEEDLAVSLDSLGHRRGSWYCLSVLQICLWTLLRTYFQACSVF